MKSHILSLLTVVLLAEMTGAQAQTNLPGTDLSKVFKSDREKFSYFIGLYAASGPKNQVKRLDIDFDADMAIKGFSDSMSGTNTLIPESEMQTVMKELNTSIKARIEAKAAKAKADGLAFLENNKNQPGVVTLSNGLQYKILKDSSGTNAAPTDEVSVAYVGTLPDGTEFDSSKPGKPLVTPIQGRIIQGWKQVLQLMKVGAKWKVFIPTELAYGEHPPTPTIPANSPLIFEMELLSAKPAPAPAAPPMGAPSAPSTPLTSDIIKVPSAEEMKKGAKVETIKAEDLEKARLTNSAPNK